MNIIKIKRVYAPFDKKDGFRILVDRLWPRGIKKEDAHIDIWMKDVAPSPALRKWFNHEPGKWHAFRNKYETELKDREALIDLVNCIERYKIITLIYAARDEQHTHAIVLKDVLNKLVN